MRQTGTQAKVQAEAKPRKPDMTLKDAAIVLGLTALLSVAIGLIPHFR
jgi:hypothetical protein